MAWGAIAAIGASLANKAYDVYKDHSVMSHADFWNQQNIALQKEFAQNSIKWRVEDAKRAGVHPMAALGISPASFSPVSSSLSYPSSSDFDAQAFGQNIDRAINAGKTKEDQDIAQGIADKMTAINLRKGELENDLLQAQIDSLRAVRNTASVPAAPPVNPAKVNPLGGTKNVPAPPKNVSDYTFSQGGLLHLSRHGDIFIEYVDPDKADSITESQAKSLGTLAAAEAEASGLIDQVRDSVLMKEDEREKIKSGKYHIQRIPGVGFRLVRSPRPLTNKEFIKLVREGYYLPPKMRRNFN